MTSRCKGFAPVARPNATLLILGSLPGQRSLAAAEYYAHPRNAFWPIMAALFDVRGSYDERCAALTRAGVALWDVVYAAQRTGSLDTNIRNDRMEINDFQSFLESHSRIETIAFNGRKAAALFRRHVLPALERRVPELVELPSTSPAHATLSPRQKLAVWRSMLAGETNRSTRGQTS